MYSDLMKKRRSNLRSTRDLKRPNGFHLKKRFKRFPLIRKIYLGHDMLLLQQAIKTYKDLTDIKSLTTTYNGEVTISKTLNLRYAFSFREPIG